MKPPKPHGARTNQQQRPRTPQAGVSGRVGAQVTPSRRAAFEILALVAERKGHSDDLLHSARTAGLSPEDRNLMTALVMGVLRWQIALDARIAGLLTRPGQQVPEPVAIALRMGVFQLLHMDRIPAHAALSESVELCKLAGHPGAAGMVNAILRKVSTTPAQPKPLTTPAQHKPLFETVPRFAERLAHPQWLVERWAAEYGRAAALRICEYDQQEPAPGGLFIGAGEGARTLPVIDDGSRLVAELAAAAVADSKKDRIRVWDCCAAPGGKTLMLAARLPGAEILATDISQRRLEQMTRRVSDSGYSDRITTAVADAQAATVEGKFDLILCDVPCSGTGTLARNPEIRLQLKPADLIQQAAWQKAILGKALRHLAPGGRLVYSTCSLEPEENEAVAAAVSSAASPLRVHRLPVEPLLRTLAEDKLLESSWAAHLLHSGVRDGALRTLPGTHPCDGFFATLFACD